MSTETKAHAVYSPSGAKRWMNCAGAIEAMKSAPPQKESEYAKEGTRAHEVMEALLGESITRRPSQYKKLRQGMCAQHSVQMVAHVEEMIDFVMREINPFGMEILIERKVNCYHIDPDLDGTVDCALVEEFGTLHIIDFKYGAGVAVDAEENEQMLTYAVALAKDYDYNFSEVKLTIVQPRAHHEAGSIRTWSTDIGYLLAFEKKIAASIANSKKKNAPRTAGEWCRWCPAEVKCPATNKAKLAEAKIEFDPIISDEKQIASALIDPKDLSSEQISKILKAANVLESWIGAVQKYAYGLASRGGKVDGFKLVPKRGTRVWIDAAKTEKEAKKKFGDKAFTTDLLSPTQLEKIASKEWVAERVTKVSSGVNLVPESDSRHEVTKAAIDFQDEPESDYNERREYENKQEESGKKSRKENQKPKTKKGSGKKRI